MKQYKLTNNKTKEETICDLVTIDGFDYYYVNELIPYTPNGVIDGNFICLSEIESNKQLNVKLGDKNYISPFVKKVGNCSGCRKIIATNDPNIDIPKIINEIEKLAEEDADSYDWVFESNEGNGYADQVEGFKNGYNKAKETYKYTEEDMIKFADWCINISKENKDILRNNPNITEKELLFIWKEQQLQIIYYN